jgi:hypothetical protein
MVVVLGRASFARRGTLGGGEGARPAALDSSSFVTVGSIVWRAADRDDPVRSERSS